MRLSVMNKLLTFLCILLLAAGCARSGNDILVIDVSHPRTTMLEELTDHITITPLDESEVLIPGSGLAKKYGNLLFLGHSVNGMVIYDGEHAIAKLDARGRAEGEYLHLYTFEYREESAELVIFDILQRKFITYHVPDMTFVSSEPFQGVYPNGLEAINARYSFFYGDGPRLYDHQRHEYVDSIRLTYAQTTFDPVREPGGKSLLFAIPGPISRIMRASMDGFETVRKFTYKPKTIEDSFWDLTTDDYEKVMQIYEELVNKEHFAFSAMDPYFRDNDFAWWYYAGRREIATGTAPNMTLFRCIKGRQEVFSEIRVEGYPMPVQPDIADGEQWGMVLELAILEKIANPKGPVYPRLRALADQGYEHVLLMFDVF